MGETVVSGLEVKQLQAVLEDNPAVLLRIPAKTTPWWDRIILAQTWRDTILGGDLLLFLWDIFRDRPIPIYRSRYPYIG